jgi:hypothetical protein
METGLALGWSARPSGGVEKAPRSNSTAGMTAGAFIQVKGHRDLRPDIHRKSPCSPGVRNRAQRASPRIGDARVSLHRWRNRRPLDFTRSTFHPAQPLSASAETPDQGKYPAGRYQSVQRQQCENEESVDIKPHENEFHIFFVAGGQQKRIGPADDPNGGRQQR